MIAAGLDGIDHKIDPGEPTQIDPADYSDEERQRRHPPRPDELARGDRRAQGGLFKDLSPS